MKRAILASLIGLLGVGGQYAADLDKARAAIEREDYATALRELRPLAEEGVAEAQCQYGLLLYNGYTVPEDYEQASRWFTLAADQGHAEAQYWLALMYHIGLGVEKNLKKAAELDQKAADQGHARAQLSMAFRYDLGYWGVPQNQELASELYEKAALQDLDNAQVNIGGRYCAGVGVSQDFARGYFWQAVYLAKHPNDHRTRESRDECREQMSPGQIEQAEALVREWNEKHSVVTEPSN